MKIENKLTGEDASQKNCEKGKDSERELLFLDVVFFLSFSSSSSLLRDHITHKSRGALVSD